jgi:WXG100 family type VII secretion target
MEQTARNFEQTDASLRDMLKNLMNQLEPLQQSFQGAGGRSFTEVKIAWSRDQTALHEALAQTAQAIRTSGHEYTASDSDASRRFGGTAGNLPL